MRLVLNNLSCVIKSNAERYFLYRYFVRAVYELPQSPTSAPERAIHELPLLHHCCFQYIIIDVPVERHIEGPATPGGQRVGNHEPEDV